MSQRRNDYSGEKWCINLNQLRKEYAQKQPKGKVSNEAFGEFLGIGTTSVFDYCGGYKQPRIPQLLSIVNAFNSAPDFDNISLEWLLNGEIDGVRTPDTTVQAICEYTGLSEQAIENLHSNIDKNGKTCYLALDYLLKWSMPFIDENEKENRSEIVLTFNGFFDSLQNLFEFNAPDNKYFMVDKNNNVTEWQRDNNNNLSEAKSLINFKEIVLKSMFDDIQAELLQYRSDYQQIKKGIKSSPPNITELKKLKKDLDITIENFKNKPKGE